MGGHISFPPRILICTWWPQGKGHLASCQTPFAVSSSGSSESQGKTAGYNCPCPVPIQWFLAQLWGPGVPLLETSKWALSWRLCCWHLATQAWMEGVAQTICRVGVGLWWQKHRTCTSITHYMVQNSPPYISSSQLDLGECDKLLWLLKKAAEEKTSQREGGICPGF